MNKKKVLVLVVFIMLVSIIFSTGISAYDNKSIRSEEKPDYDTSFSKPIFFIKKMKFHGQGIVRPEIPHGQLIFKIMFNIENAHGFINSFLTGNMTLNGESITGHAYFFTANGVSSGSYEQEAEFGGNAFMLIAKIY